MSAKNYDEKKNYEPDSQPSKCWSTIGYTKQ